MTNTDKTAIIIEMFKNGMDDDSIKRMTNILWNDTEASVKEQENNFQNSLNNQPKDSLEDFVSNILLEMGMEKRSCAFSYMCDILIMSIYNPYMIFNMNSTLYPKLQEKYMGSVKYFEPTIRNGIKKIWNSGNADVYYRYCEYTDDNNQGIDKIPTAFEFICMLSNAIRFKYKNLM